MSLKFDTGWSKTLRAAKIIIHSYPQGGIIPSHISDGFDGLYNIYIFFTHVALLSHFFKVEAVWLSHLCLLFVQLSLCLWWLTLLSWVGINSLRKAYPILKPRIHRDPVGLVGLKASYWWEWRG